MSDPFRQMKSIEPGDFVGKQALITITGVCSCGSREPITLVFQVPGIFTTVSCGNCGSKHTVQGFSFDSKNPQGGPDIMIETKKPNLVRVS